MAKLDAAKVKQDAHGKWPSILESLGIDRSHLMNRHGPCPICQDGKDRFKFDDKGDGRWFCSQCPKQSGDGFGLLMGVRGWTFPQAVEEVAKQIGTARPVAIRQGPDPAAVKADINTMWKTALGLNMVPEAVEWWQGRVGSLPTLCDVRATPVLRYPGAGLHPAMLALIRGADGVPVNLHRTYLAEGGRKADVDEARRVMPLSLPEGCAVRLFKPGPVLGIAEGIETAVAASMLFDVPVWASLNTTLLEKWQPPEGVRVIVFGDNDGNFAGQAAAFGLAKRLKTKKFEVSVQLPPAPGMDWNDVWRARANGETQRQDIAA